MFRYNAGLTGGYFVSQEQIDAAIGKLVRQRKEAEQLLVVLKNEALELSKLFTGLGDIVKPDKVWNISLDSYLKYLSKDTYDAIGKLKAGIRDAERELGRLNDEASKLGA
jgi:hypothetical protein